MSEFLIILVLVVANGIFAGAEIAVVASRRTRIQDLAQEGRPSAKALLSLRNDPERFLATVQIGITVVSAAAAAFGGASLAERLAPHLARVSWIGERAEGVALGLVIATVSFLSIVLGELVPKSLALRNAERYALVIAMPLRWLSKLASPLVWVLSASANIVLRPFGDRTNFMETRHSVEELQQLVEEAGKSGSVHPDAAEIASRALDLPTLRVLDVMVRRQRVVMLQRDVSQEDLRRTVADHPHSRFPVYEDHIDNIVGYIAVKDLFLQLLERNEINLEGVLRRVTFVPENKSAADFLEEMRSEHRQFAVVVDEQGGFSGVVTMEDLVEELVGDIFSEHVRETPNLMKREASGSVLVRGTVPIREVIRELGIDLPTEGTWTTIAGLCLDLAGRIPSQGEIFSLANGVRLEIADASLQRVRLVRVYPKPENTEES